MDLAPRSSTRLISLPPRLREIRTTTRSPCSAPRKPPGPTKTSGLSPSRQTNPKPSGLTLSRPVARLSLAGGPKRLLRSLTMAPSRSSRTSNRRNCRYSSSGTLNARLSSRGLSGRPDSFRMKSRTRARVMDMASIHPVRGRSPEVGAAAIFLMQGGEFLIFRRPSRFALNI